MIKDPQNNYDGKSPGLILANLRLLQGEGCKAPRPANRYDNETTLNVYCYVYSCVELAPQARFDKVRARIEMSFCDLRPNQDTYDQLQQEKQKKIDENKEAANPGAPADSKDKDKKDDKLKPGDKKTDKKLVHPMIIESQHITKNPIFGDDLKGEVIVAPAKVTGGLDMAPSLILTVYNLEDPELFSKGKYKEIGSCYISPAQCRVVKGHPGELAGVEPQYYTLMGPGGTIQGKILMLIAFSKNLKESLPAEDFKKEFELKTNKYRLDFSCIGLRNLDSKCLTPEVTLRIPSYQLMIRYKHAANEGEIDAQETKIKNKRKEFEKPELKKQKSSSSKTPVKEEPPLMDRGKEVKLGEELLYWNPEPDTGSYISTLIEYNPNICTTNKIRSFDMPENPLYWPRLEIQVFQKSQLLLHSEYFTTVDLVECSDKLPKHNVTVLKEKLGMIKKSTDGGGEDNEPGNEDKAVQGMQETVYELF